MTEKSKKLFIVGGVILVAIIGIICFSLFRKDEIESYVVSFDSNGGLIVEEQVINSGELAKKPEDPVKEEYIFIGWKLDGQIFDFSTKIEKNITLIAEWKKIESEKEMVTVSFDSNGGSIVSSQIIEKNTLVTKPNIPVKEGYKFIKWTLNKEEFDFTQPVNQNIKLVAEWEKENDSKPSSSNKPSTPEKTKYTVKFDTNGGSSIPSQTIIEGGKATKPTEPTRNGYIFVGWTLNGTSYDFNSKVTGNITVKANWKEKEKEKYTVTFDTNGGSSVPSQTVNKGEKATKPADPTRSGYIFTEWTLNGTSYDFNSKVTGNITVKANWKEKKKEKYTVTFDTNGGTSVPSQTVNEGENATKPADPTRSGYIFAGWTLNGTSYDFNSKVTGNITVKANWNQLSYTIKISSVDDYSPARILTVYENGKQITVKEIKYSDGTHLCSGTNPNVNKNALEGETSFIVVLNDGTHVNAKVN